MPFHRMVCQFDDFWLIGHQHLKKIHIKWNIHGINVYSRYVNGIHGIYKKLWK